eukprot:157083-Rhodomonas_salina.1
MTRPRPRTRILQARRWHILEHTRSRPLSACGSGSSSSSATPPARECRFAFCRQRKKESRLKCEACSRTATSS